MNHLKPLFLSCALSVLPVPAAPAAPAPVAPASPKAGMGAEMGAYMEAFPGTSALATLGDCVNYLEACTGPKIPDWVVHSTVYTYWARKPLYDATGHQVEGNDGKPATTLIAQSGRIFYPPVWRVPFQRNLPLVVYPHFTAIRKQSVPSEFGGHEWIFGAAAALYYGFAVAMPDLPGAGADVRSYHPFCHAQSLAYALVDGIPAMRDCFHQDPYLVAGRYAWDGHLFLIGYSEGGYAALAAVKEMETHAAEYMDNGRFFLSGSACMAGPFDLSGLSREALIKPGGASDFCYFLPYLLKAYREIYGPGFDLQEVFAPALMEMRQDGNILTWLDGRLDGFTVNDLIAHRLGKPWYEIPFRDVLKATWVAGELDDPGYETSVTRRILQENDLHRGWAPTRPILFCHSPADDDVAFQQSLAAMDFLGAEILKAGGNPKQLLVLKPIGTAQDGITHVMAIPRAMSMGFDWIHQSLAQSGNGTVREP